MRLTMTKALERSALPIMTWDVGIVGRSVDDRGVAATRYTKGATSRLITVEYDPETFTVQVEGSRIGADEIEAFAGGELQGTVLIEATTTGFAEILLVTRGLMAARQHGLSLLYLEPASYSNPRRRDLLHRRDFALSEEVPGYRAIPGSTLLLSDRRRQRGVFFLGYEESRLERALEDFQMIQPRFCELVFGVPAFRPGWEMNSFANNIRVLRDRNLRGGLHFCGAENPLAAYRTLNRVKRSAEPGEELFVAPIGTKPNGIGAALFVAENPDVGVLYDHPRRKAMRSSATSAWHLFDVAF